MKLSHRRSTAKVFGWQYFGFMTKRQYRRCLQWRGAILILPLTRQLQRALIEAAAKDYGSILKRGEG